MTLTDSGAESDKIYVFCSRPLYCYQSTGSSITAYTDAKYKFKYKITPAPSDMLSILFYGSNIPVTFDAKGNASQSVSTQLSGAYLRKANASEAAYLAVSNQSVVSFNTNVSARYSIKDTIAEKDIDIYPPTPY